MVDSLRHTHTLAWQSATSRSAWHVFVKWGKLNDSDSEWLFSKPKIDEPPLNGVRIQNDSTNDSTNDAVPIRSNPSQYTVKLHKLSSIVSSFNLLFIWASNFVGFACYRLAMSLDYILDAFWMHSGCLLESLQSCSAGWPAFESIGNFQRERELPTTTPQSKAHTHWNRNDNSILVNSHSPSFSVPCAPAL